MGCKFSVSHVGDQPLLESPLLAGPVAPTESRSLEPLVSLHGKQSMFFMNDTGEQSVAEKLGYLPSTGKYRRFMNVFSAPFTFRTNFVAPIFAKKAAEIEFLMHVVRILVIS